MISIFSSFKCFWRKQLVAAQDGYTLVESVVALSIFAAILLPVGMVFSYLVAQRQTEHEIVALNVARNEMETLLQETSPISETKWVHDKWRVAIKVSPNEALNKIEVRVFLQKQTKPLTTLYSMKRLK